MVDQKFFKNSGEKSLQQLADLSGSKLSDKADPETIIRDVAPLQDAGDGDLSFLDNRKYKDLFESTNATACVIHPDMASSAPDNVCLLLNENPYKAYARIAQAFYPDAFPEPAVASSASIDSGAHVEDDCFIDEGVVIRTGARIGKGSWIGANTVIGHNVEVGERSRIGDNVTLSHSVLGNNVRIYPGCRIGQDGFGFAIDKDGHVKVPQLGRVIIEDYVEIGANTTIDRGAGPDTVIGMGTWIDNLVQIGHNVRIGKGCVIVSQVGISGSTVVEDYVMMGGQAGITGHLHIGKGAKIGAQSGVMKDVEAGAEIVGAPAIPIRQFMRQTATLSRLSRQKSKGDN